VPKLEGKPRTGWSSVFGPAEHRQSDAIAPQIKLGSACFVLQAQPQRGALPIGVEKRCPAGRVAARSTALIAQAQAFLEGLGR
jgi:hypothetical protein